MKNIVIAMMNESVSVKGIDGNYMLLKDVLTFEGIPRVIIEKLFDTVKANELSTLIKLSKPLQNIWLESMILACSVIRYSAHKNQL